jgi:hypothetical protein
MKNNDIFSLRIETTSPIHRDAMPDCSNVGTSGGKKIQLSYLSAVVCASRALAGGKK